MENVQRIPKHEAWEDNPLNAPVGIDISFVRLLFFVRGDALLVPSNILRLWLNLRPQNL